MGEEKFGPKKFFPGEHQEESTEKSKQERREEEKEEKQRWEESFQENLTKWQNKLLELKGEGDQEKIAYEYREDKEFLKRFEQLIYNAPREFKFMILDVSFTPQDMKEWTACERIEEKWKIKPYYSGPKGKKYQIPLAAPRLVDWNKSGFTEQEILHRGSWVREWRALHPDLQTIKIFRNFRDKETNQSTQIQVQSLCQSTGLFEDIILLFPRNLEKITLTKEPPFYFNSEDKEFIDEWYKKEMKE